LSSALALIAPFAQSVLWWLKNHRGAADSTRSAAAIRS
jgi:hypothetical protein